ncbi:MAG TPA: leucyl aminopeptidase [Campylobacterales bacterium]|nr:leucyl aminopeptidase [Campylobacterales bacterium]
MNIQLSEKKIKDLQADCEIIIVIDGDLDHKWIEDKETLESIGFEGKSEDVAFLPEGKKVYVGSDSYDKDEIRLAISTALKEIENTKYKTIKIGSSVDKCPVSNTKALVEGAILGTYTFDRYKSEKKEKVEKTLIISTEDMNSISIGIEHAKKSLNDSQIIAEVTNSAKTLVNTAPQDMTPEVLANYAQNLADTLPNVTCFIGDEKFLEEQKMGAFLAVSRASINKPRFIHLSYKPQNPKEKFVYVGKGLTYDSGGLSIKPADFMVSMKSDMSGSATVLSILEGAARLKLPFEIDVVIGSCENMIDGSAYKPDDVLVARNGKTIEVKNTDAEGRLVLADCLCYACELEPDYLIDVATLTGACVVAVGEYTTGIMGHNGALKHELLKSAKSSGELVATLQFNKYLKKLTKSKIADMTNVGSNRYGGAITAGMFLDNFVTDEVKQKWMHWDIAGPAFVDSAWGYNQAGASGAGVRLALYWMQSKTYNKKH